MVQAIAPGKATITATSKADPNVSASYALAVQQKKAGTSNTAGTGSSGSAAATAPAQTNPEPAQPTYEEQGQSGQAPDPAPAEPEQPNVPQPGDPDYDPWGGPVLSSPIDNDCPPEDVGILC